MTIAGVTLAAGALSAVVVGGVAYLGNDVHLNAHGATQFGLAVGATAVAIMLLLTRQGQPLGLVIAAAGFAAALTFSAAELASGARTYRAVKAAMVVGVWPWMVSLGLLAVFAVLLFPDGRPPTPRWWIVGVGGGAAIVVMVVSQLTLAVSQSVEDFFSGQRATGRLGLVETALDWGQTGLSLAAVGALLSLAARVHRARGAQRRAMIVYGVAAVVLTAAFHLELVEAAFPQLELHVLSGRFEAVGYALLVAGLGAAVLGYHVFDLDIAANRIVAYTAFTAVSVTVFIGVVAGLSAMGSGGAVDPVIAIAVVALVAEPVRRWMQRGANRLTYGDRDDPYLVMTGLGSDLKASTAGPALMSRVVRRVAEALHLPFVAVEDRFGIRVVEWGHSPGVTEQFPLVAGGTACGALVVAPAAGSDALEPAERRLLADLAAHVALVVEASKLSDDLHRSREELVRAVEDERRRIRSDLHDGLGPMLATVVLGLDAASKRLTNQPALAELLTDLRIELDRGIDDLRRLVTGLRPPAIDDLGLVAAIEAQATTMTQRGDRLTIVAAAADPLPALPAAVEVAAYRIALEAMTNVVRHASARQCRVSFQILDGTLVLDVVDDGVGLAESATRDCGAGVGVESMQQRAELLGGRLDIRPGIGNRGTIVHAELPLEPSVLSP